MRAATITSSYLMDNSSNVLERADSERLEHRNKLHMAAQELEGAADRVREALHAIKQVDVDELGVEQLELWTGPATSRLEGALNPLTQAERVLRQRVATMDLTR